jgi:hypothetical protein
MRVTFLRHETKGRLACSWEALRGKRTRVPGPYMGVGRDLPHDLAQYVVEAAAEVEHGGPDPGGSSDPADSGGGRHRVGVDGLDVRGDVPDAGSAQCSTDLLFKRCLDIENVRRINHRFGG